MSNDPYVDPLKKLRADLTEAPTNPADNDYAGLCIQCMSQPAQTLELFADVDPTECKAFCSFHCAQFFAFEMANLANEDEIILAEGCKHDVRDGVYCPSCKGEFIAAAQAATKGGAA